MCSPAAILVGANLTRERGVRKHIVRVSWFLNPERLEASEFSHNAARGGQIPMLVGIEHQNPGIADNFAQHGGPAQVARFIGRSDFSLKALKP